MSVLLSVSLKTRKISKILIFKLSSACFLCVLPNVLFDHSLFRLLCFFIESLKCFELEQFFCRGFWVLFLHLLVCMKGFWPPQVSCSCLVWRKRRCCIKFRFKQRFLLSPGRMLWKLWFSPEVDCCRAL